MADIGEVSHQKSSSEEEEEAEDLAQRILYDPQKWPYLKKYRILFLVALPAFLTPLSNTSLYPAISDMKEEFETTAIIINLLLGIYIIFRGIAPIFWSSYSDQLKTRKRVYLASLLIYTMSNIICGFAKNAIILILFGIIQSIGISAALSLGGGTVSDVFIPAERGKAYAIYLVGYFIALASGQNIGDLITNSLGWRWVFYILAILGGATLLLITSFLPETFREPEEKFISKPHIIRIIRESQPQSPSEESKSFTQKKSYNPLLPLKLLLQLNITFSILSKSLVNLIIYTQSILITKMFSYYYNVSNLYLLFAYISPPVGYLIGSFIAGIYSDRLAGYESDIETRKEKEMKKEEKKRLMKEETMEVMQNILENRDIIYRFPVMRIKVAFYSSLIVPLFIVAYGWLTQIKVHILIPLIISFLAGIGLQGQCNCISTYLIDANPGKSASALALSDFISYFFVAILIVLVNPLVDLIGMGFTYTIMAFFSILSIILLVIVFKNDEKWRSVNL
ncbi:major facilitator superfamily domain-containing protein [Rhizophagus diaphanus]|nr:major facilitator superfamily domain-containing protein [Rhizophagus diaphanus] [Rhizophagus sp. MUCL 43196]